MEEQDLEQLRACLAAALKEQVRQIQEQLQTVEAEQSLENLRNMAVNFIPQESNCRKVQLMAVRTAAQRGAYLNRDVGEQPHGEYYTPPGAHSKDVICP